MDDLPTEIHKMIIDNLQEDAEKVFLKPNAFIGSTKGKKSLRKLVRALQGLLHLSLTSHYYEALATPALDKQLRTVLRDIKDTPWQRNRFEKRDNKSTRGKDSWCIYPEYGKCHYHFGIGHILFAPSTEDTFMSLIRLTGLAPDMIHKENGYNGDIKIMTDPTGETIAERRRQDARMKRQILAGFAEKARREEKAMRRIKQ
ncbi:uncharacterized protein KY384_000775 [Bacidia gigantensis]|uniref:uncharacterized protein n=1 Tax=Bacidia gigantensis TaxID=2732470 RepID=UPI001D0381F5|nr:uncharacterized protein KY384_000775 [Bacidia gigantensis]KAG8526013.1 hypothetical protein KY384_000775 [Bacidia gigantensis]